MRAVVHAGGAIIRSVTKIAFARDLARSATKVLRYRVIRPRRVCLVHYDGVIRTLRCTTAASDAQRIVDSDNFGYTYATNSARWTSDQTYRVFTVVARSCNKESIIFVSLSDKAGTPPMRVCTASHAIIAPGADV